MLSGSLLNSNATLNHFHEMGSLEIFRGEEIVVQIRLKDRQSGNRYIPAVGAVITIGFNTSKGKLSVVATANADDRSMVSLTLQEADTELILSGDLKITVVEGTVTKKGQITDGIQMVTEC